MIENLRKFIIKLASNHKLQEDFNAITSKGSIENAYNFALKNSDGGLTKEEFEEYLSELIAEAEYAKKNILNDKYLENVAGGINLPGKEFWQDIKGGKIKGLGTKETNDQTTAENAINYIYGQEKELQAKKNTAETIQAGMGALSSLVGFITTIGNLSLSLKDLSIQKRARKDAKLDRKVKHYENMLEINKLEQECREMGIELS